jgi:hypothetical protein
MVGSSKKHDGWVVQEPSCDMQALAHPARIAFDALLLSAAEAHEVEEVVDAFPLQGGLDAVELAEVPQPNSSPSAIEKVMPRTASTSRGRRRITPVLVRYARRRSWVSTTFSSTSRGHGRFLRSSDKHTYPVRRYADDDKKIMIGCL